MFRRYTHPLFRQTTAPVKGKAENREPAGEIKAEAVEPDFEAAWLYPSPRLAQAYVVWQKYGQIYSPAEALKRGTIFPELYSPYQY